LKKLEGFDQHGGKLQAQEHHGLERENIRRRKSKQKRWPCWLCGNEKEETTMSIYREREVWI